MSDSQVELVKQRTDIVAVIGERVSLKRSGRNFKGLCPFHGEKTPSFFVTPEMQLYKCFGCGAGGDVLAFLQAFEGMSFPEALEALAKKAGITLEKVYRTDKDRQRERLLEVLHLASELYHYLLTKHRVGKRARAYLIERGITQQTIKDYLLGYAPNSWQTAERYLTRKKGYSCEELILAGLSVRSSQGRTYDRFRGRIMFPQQTPNGTVVGFSGRVLDSDTKEAPSASSGQAKYINSPETEVYHKGEVLYGLYQARPAVRKANRVVVVEGEFDVLSSVQAHVKETIAIKGSALTREQGLLIKRLATNAILALDADQAGQEAMTRAITVAEPMGMTLQVVQVVGGKDPDEVACKTPKQWREMVEQAVSVYQYYLNLATSRFDPSTGNGQREITRMVLPIYAKIENKVEQAFYLKKLGEVLKVPQRLIEEEMARAVYAPVKTKSDEAEKTREVMDRREKLERYVIGAGLHFDDNGYKLWDKLEEKWFREKYLQRLISELKKQPEVNKSITISQILSKLPIELQPVFQELYSIDPAWFEMNSRDLEKTAFKAVSDLQTLAIRSQIDLLSEQIAKEKDEQKLQELHGQYQTCLRNLREADSS